MLEKVRFGLNVAPERLSLGKGSVLSLSRSTVGDLWGVGRSFVQVRGGGVLSHTDLPAGVSASLLMLAPDGAAWARGNDGQF